jgi:hypothetical protein
MEGFAPRSADGLVRCREPDNRGPTPRPIRAALPLRQKDTPKHRKTSQSGSTRSDPWCCGEGCPDRPKT